VVVVVAAGIFLLAQGVHLFSRLTQVLAAVYPQRLALYAYFFLYVLASCLLLALVLRQPTVCSGVWCRRCATLIVLSVLFLTSVIAYRQGVDNYNRTSDDEPIMSYAQRFAIPPDLAFLREMNQSSDRVIDLTRPFDRILSTAGVTVLPLAGLSTVGGYSSIFPYRYHQYISRAVNGVNIAPTRVSEVVASPAANMDALKLLGVKYVLAYDGTDVPRFVPLSRHEPTGKVVYTAESSVGPAFVSPGVHCVENDDEALNTIHATHYEALIARAILVRSDPQSQSLCRGRRFPGSGVPMPAHVKVQRGNDRVVIEVESGLGGILTLSDTYYPGWQAFVDGVEVPILRTYTTLRGVAIGPGHHFVNFKFSPGTFWALLGLSGAFMAFLLLGVMWALALRYREERLPLSSSI